MLSHSIDLQVQKYIVISKSGHTSGSTDVSTANLLLQENNGLSYNGIAVSGNGRKARFRKWRLDGGLISAINF